ncbi:NUDIX hydrolase [Pseudonocardia alni]|uniref:NUDIX hydrolase n=1 Tax=Pseudonocardia alni TaxID=33907 RepID=UPI00280B1F99|nr:NUDIX hydrolase [Pseudonocardia alni]
MSDPSETFATPRVAAGALFLDEAGRILLVHPTYKDTWDIPGGYVERGESPAAACRREIAEELGLTREPVALLSVDWAPSEKEGDKLLFVFDCGRLGGDAERIRLADDELDRWKWVAIDELESYVIPRLARRLRATAFSDVRYLEHGESIRRHADER